MDLDTLFDRFNKPAVNRFMISNVQTYTPYEFRKVKKGGLKRYGLGTVAGVVLSWRR